MWQLFQTCSTEDDQPVPVVLASAARVETRGAAAAVEAAASAPVSAVSAPVSTVSAPVSAGSFEMPQLQHTLAMERQQHSAEITQVRLPPCRAAPPALLACWLTVGVGQMEVLLWKAEDVRDAAISSAAEVAKQHELEIQRMQQSFRLQLDGKNLLHNEQCMQG